MTHLSLKISSPLGPLTLSATDSGISGLYFRAGHTSAASGSPADRHLAQGAAELKEYFSGKRKIFTLPLDPAGTPFQRRVWSELARIPFGATVSYANLAIRVGAARAFRAVGSANGRNPLCIFLPCHRVIASNGSLGGYSGGLEIKRRLLELERA